MAHRQVDDWGQEELVAPEIRLVQKTTTGAAEAMQVKPGNFFNVITQEDLGSEIEIVIVDLNKNRTYWGSDEIGDSPPLCSSMDAKSMVSISGEDCSKCEFRVDNPWLLKADERRDKCLPSFMIWGLLLTGDEPLPFILRASGISSRAVQALFTRFRLNKNYRDPKTGNIMFNIAKVLLKSAEQKTPYGLSFALSFGEITLFNDENTEKMMLALSESVLGSSAATLEAATQDQPEQIETTTPPEEKAVEKAPATKKPATQKVTTEYPEADDAAQKTLQKEAQRISGPRVVQDNAPEETEPVEENKETAQTGAASSKPIDLDI